MRAVHYTAAGAAAEVIELVEVADPVPAADEVLVRVAAVGLNPVDVKIRAAGSDFGPIEYSPLPGWDLAGEVVATGAAVTSLEVGDAVFGLARFPRAAHTLAELVAVPATDLARAPASWKVEQQGAAPLAVLTAWHAFEAAGLGRDATGQRVLVLGGAGGVGHLAIQVAKARGAHVVATASPAKHAVLAGLGADELVDYRDDDALAAIAPVDVVLSTVGDGVPPLGAVREGTAVITITAFPDGAVETLRAAGATGLERIMVAADGAALAEVAALADQDRLTVLVDAAFPLDEVVAAQERLETGRVTGKVVVTLP
ncbi:NADP-dependent oxidoreductase [Nocardioides kongjuensis]|uniref:NADPH:quinone reductase-like Zn-dependent oxidoreductase n=1 Tax=Nocardioides kongjuensis TaxID=349522 RepID=A0A852RR39_9ACTN|nr:NADP-dependent oxidoreductase [Nocardioides kongjuensis]NYD30414.1 NADPH:quinone reductase-like Zn-dependent oxidoreductase [Nocardioides kongjuensis]